MTRAVNTINTTLRARLRKIETGYVMYLPIFLPFHAEISRLPPWDLTQRLKPRVVKTRGSQWLIPSCLLGLEKRLRGSVPPETVQYCSRHIKSFKSEDNWHRVTNCLYFMLVLVQRENAS